MFRIGIDVGGTNTDAVLIDENSVVGAVKSPTTEDVTTGIKNALVELKRLCGDQTGLASSITLGTTHFINAVVERKRLNKIAALRICLPAAASLPPFIDWPADIAALANGGIYMVRGGAEYDGRPIGALDEKAISEAARSIRNSGITSVAVSSVFSPLISDYEKRAEEILRSECPDIRVTCSHTLGRIGLLERENATLLNASLLDLAEGATDAFQNALEEIGIAAPLFISLNDGTVTSVKMARKYPVYCFASGATNSMRGAAYLSHMNDAIVCDVGGTTADIGCLVNGFPRQANSTVSVGGVRTLFRMPDLLSIGVGGGTKVSVDPVTIGPESVGFRLQKMARVFGGEQLTLTDIAVAAGLMDVGDKSRVSSISGAFVETVLDGVREKLEIAIDKTKIGAADVPLIAVGGGAALVPKILKGISEVHHVENQAVANAVGAAIAQISGEVDQIFSGMSREDALSEALRLAEGKAIAAGASEADLKVVEMEDLPISYLPGHAIRARIRVVGDIQ
ncbi:hydantoinase/oxoprolinase N-terminal domain-containing protein [Sneathiella sp.]|jgi:N-methylhydantoinase A/oxoprolinase/acetone carboxylase beta subunit|uniref:hydantoinase/oxoprolinase N-terminal domain-containing protein n=1 Tax=Sneathiella sp. TaxID=1964365 RepID=UPI0039E6A231